MAALEFLGVPNDFFLFTPIGDWDPCKAELEKLNFSTSIDGAVSVVTRETILEPSKSESADMRLSVLAGRAIVSSSSTCF